MYEFEAMMFNIHDSYLEMIVRGHKASLSMTFVYNNFYHFENMDNIKMYFSTIE